MPLLPGLNKCNSSGLSDSSHPSFLILMRGNRSSERRELLKVPPAAWPVCELYQRLDSCLSPPPFPPFPTAAGPKLVMIPSGSDGKETACNSGDLGSIPRPGRSPGEGNGYPLQYSCLENPVDRGAWQATVHGVAKSWQQLE